jgi:hypothetical protein
VASGQFLLGAFRAPLTRNGGAGVSPAPGVGAEFKTRPFFDMSKKKNQMIFTDH